MDRRENVYRSRSYNGRGRQLAETPLLTVSGTVYFSVHAFKSILQGRGVLLLYGGLLSLLFEASVVFLLPLLLDVGQPHCHVVASGLLLGGRTLNENCGAVEFEVLAAIEFAFLGDVIMN